MFGPWKFTDAVASWTWDVEPGAPMTVEVYAPEGEVELRLNGRTVGQAQTNERYALFEVPYEAGTLEVVSAAGESWTLPTADVATVQLASEEVAYGDWLFVQVHAEDATGTWVLNSGQSYDCAREGYELFSAGSSAMTPADFEAGTVRLGEQGALVVYRKR
jgi:hypothetical protein